MGRAEGIGVNLFDSCIDWIEHPARVAGETLAMGVRMGRERAMDDATDIPVPGDLVKDVPNLLRWQDVWERSDVRFAGKARMDTGYSHVERSFPKIIAVPFDTEVEPGDLVVLYDGDDASVSNQAVFRAVGSTFAGNILTRNVELGPALPREEWPEALRVATVPNGLRLDDDDGYDWPTVRVNDKDGREVFSFNFRADYVEGSVDFLVPLIASRSYQGRLDGKEGVHRTFDIVPGTDAGRRSWQLVDDLGGSMFIDERGFMERRPNRFVQGVLAVARAAYAEGHAEALDIKAKMDSEEGLSPAM